MHAGPVDLFELHRLAPRDYPFLLQSVAGHSLSGRYDILFAFPAAHLAFQEGRLSASDGVPQQGQDFFATLTAWAARESRQAEEGERPHPTTGSRCAGEGRWPAADGSRLPFIGGWFLLLGYEAARLIESRLRIPNSPFKLPDALAVRCPAAAIYDRERGETHLLAEQDPVQLQRLEQDLNRVKETVSLSPKTTGSEGAGNALVSEIKEDPEARFYNGVSRIIEYLRAGDVFQVNLSRGWSATLAKNASPAELYQRLRLSNPAPFAGIALWGDSAVLSSSPERLVQVQDRQVQTRPIAGTRPRGADAQTDRLLREQLVASVKERAEHIMLIDLERNDLGRVCEPGSVDVSELMTVESYAHVHHIVSNVRGCLRSEVGPGDVLKAVFPGGTITGCPKFRAMEIIAELEEYGRGPYTGAMGYLSRDGHLDMNILIRSLVCENGQVTLRTGAGIVSDSIPEMELAETRAKARGLLKAFGVTS